MAKGASGAWLTEPSGIKKPEPVWGSLWTVGWDGRSGPRGPAVGSAAAPVLLYPRDGATMGSGVGAAGGPAPGSEARVCSERTAFAPVGLLSY